MIIDWIGEKAESFICDRYGVGPGDIRRHIETADWLLYSTGRIASLLDMAKVERTLKDLRQRVKYGIREELLELSGLRGIGRVRARNLFNSGYITLSRIREASIKDLSSVPTIGLQIAKSIKKQLQ